MSLPNYWINIEEFQEVFLKVLNENSLRVKGEVVEGSEIPLNDNLDDLKNILGILIGILNEQDTLTSETSSQLSTVLSLMKSRLEMQYMQAEDARVTTGLILGEELEIRELLKQLLDMLDPNGRSKNISLRLQTTDSNSQFLLTYTSDANIILRNVYVYQEKYDFQDNWSLRINDEYVFESVYTKYTEEQKNFISKTTLNVGDVLTFEFNNNSSKQKIINYDIEYLLQ
jgi:hypothetical protein